ncbi:MFS transporter [Aurantivibrio infirmus]
MSEVFIENENKTELFFGWKVVAAFLVVLTFTSGLSFYNHAIILNALSQQPAFSVQSASIAVSVFFISGGFTGLWVAKMLANSDARVCITFGAIISFISLTALSFVKTNAQLYAVYVLFGVGFSASGLIPATTLVTRWFKRRRSVALSIASTGLSLGGVVLTPISALLVENFGLSKAAPMMGMMYLLGTIPIAWLWIRPSPESMGLQVDGDCHATRSVKDKERELLSSAVVSPAVMNPTAVRASDGISFREARRGGFFWGVSFSYIFLMMAQVGGIAHQYGLAKESLTEQQTVMAVAILPIASIIGRLVGGWLIEQFSIRAFAVLMMILQVLSLSLLSLGFGLATLCIGLALFGITVGNLLMLQPLLIAEAFGLKQYARIFSVSNLMTSWGTACGPALLGWVYTLSSQSYSVPYLVAAAAGSLGLICFYLGGPMRKV